METFSARLASFNSVVPAINSRVSSSRTIQPLRWPYESPSPEQLAHAGFFFRPYDTNPDNTMCFLCGRALDGWEDGDDPVLEHLKHSPDCGWAIIMDIQSNTSNPAEIVDPTSSSIVEARRATFAIGWPHEGKRGWLCQSEKMVEAGWYFCPNEESPDLASCPYCKLSLDGWEESDDPFEEHHRRSSECSFFVFALPAAKTKKNARAKKPRASKASRLSTQSVMTTASEAPTIDEDMTDVSIMSQSTTKKTKGTRKTTKSRAKKTKKDEPVGVVEAVEPEQVEIQAPEPARPKRATRGKKRGSEAVTQEMSVMTVTDEPAVNSEPSPSPKRRATEIRRSVSQQPEDIQPDIPDEAPLDVATSPVMPKKGRKGAKRGTSTRTRKTSTASSSGTGQSRIPDDSILEAAIEADLARKLEDPEPFEFHYKDEERESARFRQQSISTSIRAPSEARYDRGESQEAHVEAPKQAHMEDLIIEVVPEPKQKKQTKRKATAKKSKKGKAPEPEPEPEIEPEPEPVQEPERDPEPEVEPEPAAESEVEPESEAEPETVGRANSKSKRISQSKPSKVQQRSNHAEEAPQVMMEVEPVVRQGSVVTVEIDMNDLPPESDQEMNDYKPPKKQGRKAASKGKKPAASKRKESEIVTEQEKNEPAGFDSQEILPDAPKPPRRESKRKSKETKEDSMIVDRHEELPLAPAQKETVDEQPAKAKRGQPSKESQEVSRKENPVVEVKSKRGRPSKQRSIPAEEDLGEHSKKSRVPPKNTQRYSDLPKDRHRAQSFIESVTQETPSPQRLSPNNTHSTTQERTPSPSPQASDAENQPPSTRPPSARPPVLSPSKPPTARIPIAASTPMQSPSKRQANSGYLSSTHSWAPMEIEELLGSMSDKENRDFAIDQDNLKEILTSPEKKMTVEEWIYYNAKNGEERLRRECERLISIFEREGGRAMRALEGIECID
ncbi:chromosome segregation protein BIR1, putative [Talaromyces stipitatus ATCC 10500]|uniref:Chromosome segregation protein BIR1, putative n=1 Tax=Talaromyces stipitatus (strain ATCC 10500 / CBS 375.48 / QM 6759 / NRRL 1006) TaxID=441959 RepID=B8M3C7_TALSN|nr:chromosome segregation protein BIR1, putative [Talaromyces stipitatus ATCC 10500]EED22299.1 chromosome segregation protein BIR1, putative [Talaromyces stipitatus ATCC 10500]